LRGDPVAAACNVEYIKPQPDGEGSNCIIVISGNFWIGTRTIVATTIFPPGHARRSRTKTASLLSSTAKGVTKLNPEGDLCVRLSIIGKLSIYRVDHGYQLPYRQLSC